MAGGIGLNGAVQEEGVRDVFVEATKIWWRDQRKVGKLSSWGLRLASAVELPVAPVPLRQAIEYIERWI
jgi:hypothetical protein